MFMFLLVISFPVHALAAARGWVTLVNSTPYRWMLIYSHEYQMRAWEPSKVVEPGTASEFYYEYSSKVNKDDAAEATYQILGFQSPISGGNDSVSFTIQARTRTWKRIEVQYGNGFFTLNNPESTLLDIGREEGGSVPFTLAGDGVEKPFISNNPPVAWMQASLSDIINKPLNQICLLASHDAGASQLTKVYTGVKHNTITQSNHIYEQLISGARYLDVRPVVRRNKWYTAHLTVVNRHTAFGSFTRTLRDVIEDLNRFTAGYPGELIIIDLSHDLSRKNWARLSKAQWFDLYRQLSAINDLWQAPSTLPLNITTVPLSTFIQAGSRSAVLLRVPVYAPLPTSNLNSTRVPDQDQDDGSDTDDVVDKISTLSDVGPEDVSHPLGSTNSRVDSSFVVPMSSSRIAMKNLPVFRTNRIPVNGRFSKTLSTATLTRHQLQQLHDHGMHKKNAMLRSIWTLTQNWQQVLNVGVRQKSILAMSVHARRAMYKRLWQGIQQEQVIPNVVEVDDIWGGGLVAFVMAINELRLNPPREQRLGRTGKYKRRAFRDKGPERGFVGDEEGEDIGQEVDTIGDAEQIPKILNYTMYKRNVS